MAPVVTGGMKPADKGALLRPAEAVARSGIEQMHGLRRDAEAEAVARRRRPRERHDNGAIPHHAVEQPRRAQLLSEVFPEGEARLAAASEAHVLGADADLHLPARLHGELGRIEGEAAV